MAIEPTVFDRDLLTSRLKKLEAGQKPNRNEVEAWRRLQRGQEEVDRWRFYGSIPRKHWVILSGRTYTTIQKHAARFGVPVGGPMIDLGGVARWVHNFLTTHGPRLDSSDSDPLMSAILNPRSQALEGYRTQKERLAELDVAQREGRLVDAGDMHMFLSQLAACVRLCGEDLRTRFGEPARQLLNLQIENWMRMVNNFYEAKGLVSEAEKNGNGKTKKTTQRHGAEHA